MTTVYDVPSSELIMKVSGKLKKVKQITPPAYMKYAKTGVSREMQPTQDDWWYTRCASILRRVYDNGPIGVNRLSKLYGSKKNRGMRPEKRRKGSSSIVQDALIQLETIELVATTKRGRELTPKGVSLMDKSAHEVKKGIPELSKY